MTARGAPAGLVLRTATDADVPALLALQQAYEARWFGAPEQSLDEVRETFGHADVACIVLDADRIVGHAARMHTSSTIVADPDFDLDAAYRRLVPWLEEQGAGGIESLDRDEPLRAVLLDRGWHHVRTQFELSRQVDDDLRTSLGEPSWPDGVTLRPYLPEQSAALHNLIYVDAAWTEVEGHRNWDLDAWHRLLLEGRSGAELPVLAWRGSALAGAAVLRHFDNGCGWVAQLAVARSERRRGLARALLVESYRRLIDDGATEIGLGVFTTNRGALDLYLDVGLAIDREWLMYAPPQAGRRT